MTLIILRRLDDQGHFGILLPNFFGQLAEAFSNISLQRLKLDDLSFHDEFRIIWNSIPFTLIKK